MGDRGSGVRGAGAIVPVGGAAIGAPGRWAIDAGASRDASVFEGAAEAFIDARRSSNTRRSYRAELARWLAFCARRGADPRRATLPDATALRDERLAATSPVTAQRTLAALSSIYGALWRSGSGIVAGNPFHPKMLEWPQVSNEGRIPEVAESDALAMIAAAETAGATRDALLLHLLRSTGLRRASVLALRREDFRVGATGRAAVHVVVKGGKEHEVELPDRVAALMRAWRATLPPGPGPMFPGRDPGSPLRLGTLNEVVTRWARAAGVTQPVSPHQFRVALITEAYEMRLPETEIQRMVHHARPTTTQRYDRGRRGARALGEIEAARERRAAEKR